MGQLLRDMVTGEGRLQRGQQPSRRSVTQSEGGLPPPEPSPRINGDRRPPPPDSLPGGGWFIVVCLFKD